METIGEGDQKTTQLEKTHIDFLVVGDIVQIETGKTIPVDAILISGKDVEMDESAVTGESNMMKKMTYDECIAVRDEIAKKRPEDLHNHNAVPSPLLLSGTKVFKGAGKYLSIVVGPISFMGELRESMDEEKEDTPLQNKLTMIAKHIGTIGLYAAIATVLAMLLSFFITRIRDGGWAYADFGLCFSYIVLGITVLVVAIPEGLPLAVTIALAYSVMKMYEQNNFVKTLMACETMGEVNNICTDKTGTLTKNQMTVLEMWFNRKAHEVGKNPANDLVAIKEQDRNKFFEIISVNANVEDPNATEQGFLRFIEACGYDYKKVRAELLKDESKFDRILFSSARKKSSIIITLPNGEDWLYTFGTVLRIIEASSKIYTQDGIDIPLTKEIKDDLLTDISKANVRALRTLGVAMKKLAPGEGGPKHKEKINEDTYVIEESGLTFLGYLGLRDQLRDGVKNAVTILTKHAGVTVRMVTGDNYETAIAIAKECGIMDSNTPHPVDPDIAMNGIDFYTRVGGKTWLCPKCEEEKLNGKGSDKKTDGKPDSAAPKPPNGAESKPDDNGQNVVTPKEVGIDMKEKEGGDDKKKDKDEKECPKCGTKLEVAAANMEVFKRIVSKLRVISACRPNDKYLLVAGLKYLGNVVGVTGDGSNDAPALKKADIGLAMNAGTDLAKDAAGIVLLDNNFASIQTAVNWGRNIFDSIRKFLQFQLCVNVVALILSFVGSAIISMSPLTAVQLLWVNMIMDSFASLALATDPPTLEQLERPPVKKDEYIITKVMLVEHNQI